MSVCEKERLEGTQGVDDFEMMRMIYHLSVRDNFVFIAAATLCSYTGCGWFWNDDDDLSRQCEK